MKKERKVGILTYHRAHNYGAVLQAFALRSYIDDQIPARIIDYWPEYHSKEYRMWDWRFYTKSTIGKFRYLVKYVFTWKATRKRYNAFESFISSYLLDREDGSNTLFKAGEEIPNDCSVYVYGSDQIWRSLDKEGLVYDDVYYADYPVVTNGEKKIAYAGSMGTILPKSENNFKQKMPNFDQISIRERSLKNFLESFMQRDFTLVLDPVFLLDKQRWIDTFNLNRGANPRPYLLVYNLLENQDVTRLADEIAKEKGLTVIEIVGTIRLFRDKRRFQQTAGPVEFLQLIYNASFVVASSFHGVAFSILFNKEFCASNMGAKANRVLDMLDAFQLSDRYISNHQIDQILKPIDYDTVDVLVSEKKYISRSFLEKFVIDEE